MSSEHDDCVIEQFKDFLECIDPADFDRTSALYVTHVEYAGTAGFEEFIAHKIGIAEQAFCDDEGDVAPLIWLATSRDERMFEAYHDETNLDMFDRAKGEARSMGATMFFIAMLLHAATEQLDINGLDGDEVRAAIDRGELRRHYAWYGEHRPPGVGPNRCGGLWEIAGEGKSLGQRTDGEPVVAPLFHAVLAHPPR